MVDPILDEALLTLIRAEAASWAETRAEDDSVGGQQDRRVAEATVALVDAYRRLNSAMLCGESNWPTTVAKLEEALSTFPAGRSFLARWTEAEAQRDAALARADAANESCNGAILRASGLETAANVAAVERSSLLARLRLAESRVEGLTTAIAEAESAFAEIATTEPERRASPSIALLAERAAARCRELLAERGAKQESPPVAVCSTCNDTHAMKMHNRSGDERDVPCTFCPSPCQRCRNGAYCSTTPCACDCHRRGERGAGAGKDTP